MSVTVGNNKGLRELLPRCAAQLLDEPRQVWIIWRQARETLRIAERGLEVARLLAHLDERRQDFAVVGMGAKRRLRTCRASALRPTELRATA